jgi:hydrogenase maturation protein HypF
MQQAEIRVRGRVQGVGFRPAVWRLAQEFGLSGDIRNDAEGVLIHVAGESVAIAELVDHLKRSPPALARIDQVEIAPTDRPCSTGFRIIDSAGGIARTEVAPDAAVCAECAREVLDPAQRRYRYPFANCTQCGPRISIIRAIPYDRAATTMAAFRLCPACAAEYRQPADRRFHAEAIACEVCGPQARLVPDIPARDVIDAAASLLRDGHVLAVKGLGGYQLACDATNAAAVSRLRTAKRRDSKPFALMARDLDVVRRYCTVSIEEAALLKGSSAPIVLLQSIGSPKLPQAVAPGLTTLGFMFPTTPLHLLLLHGIDAPVIMTSGNLTDTPQIIDDDDALALLGRVADFVLIHDREIATRIDDSVMRVVSGKPRMLRRARGFAPSATLLPAEFSAAPDLLAAGGELKTTFCLLKDGRAILSPHIGDLEDARTFDDYRRCISRFTRLFDHAPVAIAIDPHPEYLSSKHAHDMGLPLIEVQHHHAHLAACLAENLRPLGAPPVLAIVLDGLGWGDDGTIWGGEFLLGDYRSTRRLAGLQPVAMPGGAAAAREPWRNLYAHLKAAGLRPDTPHPLLDAMITNRINTPMASSCGRLFDAVAAALGICAQRQSHEGEAASRLEALVCQRTLLDEEDELAYALTTSRPSVDGIALIGYRTMWQGLMADLAKGTHSGVIAARFHKALAIAAVAMARHLAEQVQFDTVALSGGCFQNAVLLQQTEYRLRAAGFAVLTHSMVPANDGGLSLGQATVAAARLLDPG